MSLLTTQQQINSSEFINSFRNYFRYKNKKPVFLFYAIIFMSHQRALNLIIPIYKM